MGDSVIGRSTFITLNSADIYAVEKLLNSKLNCYSALSYNKISVEGKLYATSTYCSKFQRDNSIVKLFTGVIIRVVRIIVLSNICQCHLLSSPLGSCQLASSYCNTNILFIGEVIKTSAIPSSYDDYADINLTHFIRKWINCKNEPQLFAFKTSDIEYKCITIVNNNEMFCVTNDVRFEKD